MIVTDMLKKQYIEAFEKNKPEGTRKVFERENDVRPAQLEGDCTIIPPTIPFVGKKYSECKILVYANAENLNSKLEHLKDCDLWDRHKWAFEKNYDKFPQVYCEPIYSGALTIAAAFFCKLLNIPNIDYSTPADFIQCIAFGNLSKFSMSLENKTSNVDAKTYNFFEKSFDYIKADLINLQPDYIILPQTSYHKICSQDKGRAIFDGFEGKIFGICQMSPQVLGTKISTLPESEVFVNDKKYAEIKNWKTPDKYNKLVACRYAKIFTYIDEKMKEQRFL